MLEQVPDLSKVTILLYYVKKVAKKKNQIHNTKSWMIINIYGNYIFPIEQPFAGVATSLFGPCMDIPGLFLNLSSCVYEILFK